MKVIQIITIVTSNCHITSSRTVTVDGSLTSRSPFSGGNEIICLSKGAFHILRSGVNELTRAESDVGLV